MDRYGSPRYGSSGYGSKGGGGTSSVKSRYTLLVDNVSSATPKKDLIREMERIAGPVIAASKDDRQRCALVEFKRASDADYAYRKAHGVKMDGRAWKVSYATRADFRDFDWKWTEGGGSYSDDDEPQHTAGTGGTAYHNNTNLVSPSTRDRSRSPIGRYSP